MDAPFASLDDARNLDYTVTQAALIKASTRIRTYLRSAGYPTDPDPIPDSLVDLTCAIAQRIASMPKDLQDGVQQQAAPGFSVGYGWDAWKAKSGLDSGELAELKRIYPPLPKLIVMGSPVDLHLDE